MESFLRAIGLGCAVDLRPSSGGGCVSGSPGSCAQGCAGSSSSALGRSGRGRVGASKDDICFMDLEELAVETERGASDVEAEARRLAHATLTDALSLLTRWVQALRTKPKPDDSPATFRATFLRSDALTFMLVALARNEQLQAALRDPPLINTGTTPEEALLTEATAVLQLALRRAAAPLATPLLRAALAPADAAAAAAACELAAALKEDWAEVARGQTTRALERRLDALAYELQKSGASMPSRQGAGGRSARAFDGGLSSRSASFSSDAAASAPVGAGSTAARKAARGRLAAVARLCEAIQESQRRAEGRASELTALLAAFGLDARHQGAACLGAGLGVEAPRGGEPRSVRGSGTGGRRCADLYLRRGEEGSERPTLLEHIRCLDAEPAEASKGTCISRESESTAASSPAERSTRHAAAALAVGTWAAGPLPAELRGELAQAAEALLAESQRNFERLATQLQQRRAELLRGLTAHVEVEQERLCSLASSLSRAQASSASAPRAAAASVTDRLNVALQETRELCRRAEAVTGCFAPGSGGGVLDDLCTGQRCRAKWMDGSFYDAIVHRVLPDGFVIVNWLRPCPGHDPPLVTVCALGGDDSLHRIVPQTDVQLHHDRGRSALGTAMWFFENRQPADRQCVDCGSAQAEWASVSFGTFLCASCAGEHRQLGAEVSYVREIRGGWGWSDRDLQYLCRGGNAAFRAALDRFPAVRSAPLQERYCSRFAEHYRRQLDVLCSGAQEPVKLADACGAAALPIAASSEFLSAAEAAEIARHLRPRFEAAVQASLEPSSACSAVSRGSRPPASGGGSSLDLREDPVTAPQILNRVAAW
mmetsp:Transcript_11420/g.40555  ORF Transcript_11420/g.40555 Transcript_11420/m.40555 type:complete len:830 (+) Transcript_11420:91-2580(+)